MREYFFKKMEAFAKKTLLKEEKKSSENTLSENTHFHYTITTKMMMFEKNVLDDHLTTFAVIQHVGICVRNL